MAGWRIGFMGGQTLSWWQPGAHQELVTTTVPSRPLQVAAIAALEGDQQCVRDIAAAIRAVAMCWPAGCMKRDGCLFFPMYIWAKIPRAEPGAGLARVFARLMLRRLRSACRRHRLLGSWHDHVRFALIENEACIRQGCAGDHAMFKADGLTPAA